MNIEYELLRRRLIVFSIVVIFGLIVVLTSIFILNSKRDYNANIEGEIQSIHARTAKLINDAALVEAYQHDYERISGRGFFSEESRLSWIEQLERTASRLQLNRLQYHIDPQEQVHDSNFSIPANVSLFKSTLSLETGLVHEGDLVDIVNDLADLSAGLLVLDRCKITKINEKLSSGSGYNFTASCGLSWYKASYLEGTAEQMSDGP